MEYVSYCLFLNVLFADAINHWHYIHSRWARGFQEWYWRWKRLTNNPSVSLSTTSHTRNSLGLIRASAERSRQLTAWAMPWPSLVCRQLTARAMPWLFPVYHLYWCPVYTHVKFSLSIWTNEFRQGWLRIQFWPPYLNLNTDTATEVEKIPNEEPQNLYYLPNITVREVRDDQGCINFPNI